MVQGQVSVLKREGGEETGTFPISIFQDLSFLHFAELYYAFEEKKIFFCHHSFLKKVILSCLNINLKISHK